LNLYTYCANNPLVYIDPSGHFSLKKWWEERKDDYRVGKKVLEEVFEPFKNDDGSYALYDSNRFERTKSSFHEQLMVYESSLHDFNIEGESWGLVRSGSFTCLTGGWEFENIDLSLFDFGRMEVNAIFDNNKFGGGAMLSAWDPSVAFTIGEVNVRVTGHFFAFGAEAYIGKGKNLFNFGYSEGFGASINVSW